MIRSLDHAIAELIGPIPELRAAVLSVAPDGLVGWCWSREAEPEISLCLTQLERAVSACQEALGAARDSRSLMLTAKDTWVVARPLRDTSADDGQTCVRLILTIVFSGDLQTGMVISHARRVFAHLSAAVDNASQGWCEQLRAQLLELVLSADDASAMIEHLAADAAIELRRLDRIETLGEQEQLRLAAAIERESLRTRIATE